MRRLLLLLVVAACRREPPGPVHFAREEIRLRVRPGTLEVAGNYHFRSETDDPLTGMVFYPFPLDSAHLYPDTWDLPGFRVTRTDSGLSFPMRFAPLAEDSFFAWYRQPLAGRAARYIVTSTRRWQRPIDTARFQVTVPLGLAGARLNYRPDSTTRTDTTLTWHFTRRRFWPSEDVIVSW